MLSDGREDSLEHSLKRFKHPHPLHIVLPQKYHPLQRVGNAPGVQFSMAGKAGEHLGEGLELQRQPPSHLYHLTAAARRADASPFGP